MADLTEGRLAAVILTYGQSRRHLPLLEELERQGLPPTSTILVHNPSRGGEQAPVGPHGTESLVMQRNLGYAGAMNAGLDEAARRGMEFALLLTHDTRLHDGALDALVEATAASPLHAALGLVLEDDGSRSGVSYGGVHDIRGHVGHLEAVPPGVEGPVLDVDWVDGSALCLRVEAWRRAGGFLEHYFMYFEEAELCSRLRRAGWRVGIVLGARAVSAAGGSRRPAAYGYLYARNGFDWARREGGRIAALRFARFQLWSAILTTASATHRYGWRREGRDVNARRALYATSAARILGLADAIRGRFGPPPELLTRGSDIRGAGPGSSES